MIRRTPRGLVIAVPWVVLAISRRAEAYRPFEQTDADVVAFRWTEVELGPVALRQSGPDLVVIVPSLVINYGLAPNVEIVAEARNELAARSTSERTAKVEDVALSLKMLARAGSLQDREGVSVALEPSVLLPRFDGETTVGAQLGLIASQRWTALTVHLNAAAALTRAREEAVTLGGIVEGPWGWPIRPVAELAARATPQRGPLAYSLLYGLVGRASDTWSIDAAVRFERADRTTSSEVRTGLTWSFGRAR